MEDGKVLFVPCCNHINLPLFPWDTYYPKYGMSSFSLCFYCFVTYISISKALISIVVLEMYIYAGMVCYSSFYCCMNCVNVQ